MKPLKQVFVNLFFVPSFIYSLCFWCIFSCTRHEVSQSMIANKNNCQTTQRSFRTTEDIKYYFLIPKETSCHTSARGKISWMHVGLDWLCVPGTGGIGLLDGDLINPSFIDPVDNCVPQLTHQLKAAGKQEQINQIKYKFLSNFFYFVLAYIKKTVA